MEFDDKEFIAKQIKIYRKKAGLTQEELAEKVDLSTQHISRIENACYIPSLTSFFQIAEVLNMDLKLFGFNIKSSGNMRKDKLIKTIAVANENELIFYENAINSVNKSLREVKGRFL